MITREKIAGITGTILFTVLLYFILLFSIFTFSRSSEELEGIPVMFGTSPDAFGTEEPAMVEVVSPTPSAPTPQTRQTSVTPPTPSQSRAVPANKSSSTEQLITQTTEPSIDVKAARVEERKKREQEATERRVQEEAQQRRNQEEAQKRQINQQMSGLFGEGSGSRGNTHGEGVQGVPTGNATQGATSGIGGRGSYDLGGRGIRGGTQLGQPNYTVNDDGTVVVNITVDPAGNVILAEIGRGTNTPNATLREEALRAARKTKFETVTSTNNQKGTITYRFNLK